MKSNVKKAYEITEAKIQFVSLVDAAANLRTFLVKKAEDGRAAFTSYGRIVKADPESHYVTGIVYEPMTEDSQGNYMTEEEIAKAAYWFAKNGNQVDLQHSFEPMEGAAVVETWIAKADFEIGGEQVRKGTWLMTVEVTDPGIWAGIESGDITGFSMGGVGNYSEEDVDLDEVTKQDPGGKKGLFKRLAEAFGFDVVEKGEMAELYQERSKGTLFWDAFNSLEDVLHKWDPVTGRWCYEADEERVRESLEDFSSIITSILAGGESIAKAIEAARPVEKAGKKMSAKNRETLQGIYESLGMFLKEFDGPEDDNEKKEDKEVTKREVQQIVDAAIEKKLSGGKAAGEGSPETGVTQEAVEKMVQEAVKKALEPQEMIAAEPLQTITAEQVQEMITAAVGKAMEPVFKANGLPSNLNAAGTVEKSAGEQHYLHGIL